MFDPETGPLHHVLALLRTRPSLISPSILCSDCHQPEALDVGLRYRLVQPQNGEAGRASLKTQEIDGSKHALPEGLTENLRDGV